MRDMRRLQQREIVQLDRTHIVWLTLGVVLILGMTFALGYVVGQRSERITLAMTNDAEPLERLEAETERHRELTFYSDLAKKEKAAKAKATAEEKREPEPAVKPIVQKPAPEPKPAAVVPAAQKTEARVALDSGPSRSGDYTIQVSSFQTMEEAKAYASSLERKGFRPFIIAAEIRKKGTWYRVRLGRFLDESTAQAAKRILLDADIPAWVLRAD